MIFKLLSWFVLVTAPFYLCAHDMRHVLETMEFLPLHSHLCPLVGLKNPVLGHVVRSNTSSESVFSKQYLLPPYKHGCRYLEIKDPRTGVVYCKHEVYNPTMEEDLEAKEREGRPQLIFFDTRFGIRYGKTARGRWIVFLRKPWEQEHHFNTREEAITLVRQLGIPD